MARRKTKSVKESHVGRFLQGARYRSKRDSVPFSLTKKYLLSIATDECPVFHTPFEWGPSGLGPGNAKPNGPTLDRIEPELGYVEGNVAFISYRANRLKDNGTMQDHYDIADWIWSHLYAKPNSTPPIPKRTNLKGRFDPEPRSIPTTRFGENYDHTYNHSRTVRGEDANHSTQASSGDSMGHRGKEVGTSQTSQSEQDTWELNPAYGWIECTS